MLINPSNGYGFTVTDQRQTGIICFIGLLLENLSQHCGSIGKIPQITDRKRSMDYAIDLVLLFPGSYCTNNTRILQFRKALFNDNVVIHPVAIRQNPRYGDSFRSEPKFSQNLLRVFTSWALVCDVNNLEPHQKEPDESNHDFVYQVQRAITRSAGIETVSLDGRLWCLKNEQQWLKKQQMKNLAKCFKDLITEQTGQKK